MAAEAPWGAGGVSAASEAVGGAAVPRGQPGRVSTPTPIGHDTPVPWSGQYPFGFSDRSVYCMRSLWRP